VRGRRAREGSQRRRDGRNSAQSHCHRRGAAEEMRQVSSRPQAGRWLQGLATRLFSNALPRADAARPETALSVLTADFRSPRYNRVDPGDNAPIRTSVQAEHCSRCNNGEIGVSKTG
jgi:hypothetical protein